MKRLFKKNQVILTLLAVMIAVAGYLNYISKSSESSDDNAAEVSEDQLLLENQAAAGTETSEETADAEPGEAVFTSSDVVEFMSQVNLDKEQVRAENREILLDIINNENLTEDAKQDAVDQMVAMTTIAQKENEAETLLAAKGFDQAVVSISDDTVDVVVGRTELTDAERAQVEDIVTRKTEMPVDQVVISLMSTTDGSTSVAAEETESEESTEESQVMESGTAEDGSLED